MKKKEKEKAINLRKKGMSVRDITNKVNAAKSSVSRWVRDVKLTKKQKKHLKEKSHSQFVIEKRRKTRIKNEKQKRQKIINKAKKEINNISEKELFLIGISLYWGEGGKTQRGLVRLTNSDSRLIKVMMKFFRDICEVPEDKFRGHIHLHPHLNKNKAENYWSNISGIPKKQFFKTSQQHNKSSKNKKDSLPLGTFTIYVCDTELFLKIKGWTEGLVENII